ncbi:MAG: 3-oxoacyl-ACP reductase [Micromonosporaceae bacterium]
MADRYASFANSGPGRAIVSRLGLPRPVVLRRHRDGDPIAPAPVLVGGDGRLAGPVRQLLAAAGVEVRDESTAAEGRLAGHAAEGGLASYAAEGRLAGLVYDATGLTEPATLGGLFDFFHPLARSLRPSGRVVLLGTPPTDAATPAEAVAQRSLEGFVRSVGKEFGRGITAQLVFVAPGAEAQSESTLRFLLSARSAYVSGQVITVRKGRSADVADWQRPLAGKVALVTGAARGIGEAIATVLARDGALVVCLDRPAAGDALAAVANRLRGQALQLDLTAAQAARTLADRLSDRHAGVDVVVHNAGITRDRTLARMTREQWSAVLDVNLVAPQRITSALLAEKLIREDGRVVVVSSVNGIAGSRGQTNYATSKAGLIGLVQALAPATAALNGITANAVAPGFIETTMTAGMPMVVREAGRRMNSLAQGGQPADVAEAVAWLVSPGSGGVNGQVVRVCGQSIVGA